MAYLELTDVTKKFGSSTVVLDKINLSIKEGEFLVLVGPSGCGKSTLLNIIAGLENISSGEIKIDNKIVNDYPPKDRDIAMVFQSYALYPNLSVKENISFGLQNRKIPKEDIQERVSTVAKQLQIDHLLDRKPAHLSGGQRQRVAMGRAIARKPKIYLFDEPLSNLDAKLRVEMRMEIKLLHQKVKNTVVYVTHDQTEAMTLADKVAILNRGKLEQIAPPAEMYRMPVNMFVASFIGSPSMNMMPIKLESKDNEIFFMIKNDEGKEFKIQLPESKTKHAKDCIGKELIFGIRPEDLTRPDSSVKGPKIQAKKLTSEPTGSDYYFSFRINGTLVIGRYPPNSMSEDQVNIECQLNMENSLFFDPKSEMRIF